MTGQVAGFGYLADKLQFVYRHKKGDRSRLFYRTALRVTDLFDRPVRQHVQQ